MKRPLSAGVVALAALSIGAVACRRPAPAPAADLVSVDRGAPAQKPAPVADSLLGGERGLDHVGIAVKDLEAATRTYHEVLGFSRPTEGKLPNGIRNVNYYFADATYLETMVPWDRDKAAWLAAFTDHHSGPLFAVLSAHSHEATGAFLARRGIRLGSPWSGTIQTTGESAMPEEKWKTFFLPDGQLAGDPLYFIAYPRAPREEFLRKLESRDVRRIFYHENTALGLRAVWIAVPDLAAALSSYEAIGLARGRPFEDPALAARGHTVAAGAGEIWLLAPASPASPVATFLRQRGGPAILGVTLSAGSVPAAARLLRERTGRPLPAYPGLMGNSIRLPPELTHGAWIELAQYLVPQERH